MGDRRPPVPGGVLIKVTRSIPHQFHIRRSCVHSLIMKFLILTLCVACACADVSHLKQAGGEQNAQILRQESDVGVEGVYNYVYETDNGIKAEESGTLKKIDAETTAEQVQGQASWQSPEGEQVSFQYVADENGYQPQGSHLPTPPPIPEAIVRALEYIRAHPPPPEKN